jgi:hypothetical protein
MSGLLSYREKLLHTEQYLAERAHEIRKIKREESVHYDEFRATVEDEE